MHFSATDATVCISIMTVSWQKSGMIEFVNTPAANIIAEFFSNRICSDHFLFTAPHSYILFLDQRIGLYAILIAKTCRFEA